MFRQIASTGHQTPQTTRSNILPDQKTSHGEMFIHLPDEIWYAIPRSELLEPVYTFLA